MSFWKLSLYVIELTYFENLQRNQTLSPVDVQQFLKVVEKFNDKFAKMLNESHDMFGINMTAFNQQLLMEVAQLSSSTSPVMINRYYQHVHLRVDQENIIIFISILSKFQLT